MPADSTNADDKVPPEEVGIRCPFCGCGHHYVDNSRQVRGRQRRRTRVCRNCHKRFYTRETVIGEKK